MRWELLRTMMRAWGFKYREHPALYRAPPKDTLLSQKPIRLIWTLSHTQISHPIGPWEFSSQITPFQESQTDNPFLLREWRGLAQTLPPETVLHPAIKLGICLCR